jgi:glyoxylase-like metal-dependent hydrolase (beta-lactamase superfamily II)
MKVKQFKLGPMENFSYVVWDDRHKEAAVIDPAWEPETIEAFLREEKLTLKLLLLTHAHPDHANAARYFLDKSPELSLTVHRDDAFLLEDAIRPLNFLKGDCELRLGGTEIKVLHTPGHTPGSVSYLAGKAVFTGDTLFIGECGRADLPGSDPRALRLSLLKLAALPGETVLYPGHAYTGSVSSIAAQKEYNLYMRLAAKGEAEFVKAAA